MNAFPNVVRNEKHDLALVKYDLSHFNLFWFSHFNFFELFINNKVAADSPFDRELHIL